MRVVADTNIVLSAFLFAGTPLQMIQVFQRSEQQQLFVTNELMQEFEEVLARKKFVGAFRKLGCTPAELLDD